jgi:hypothetical protein
MTNMVMVRDARSDHSVCMCSTCSRSSCLPALSGGRGQPRQRHRCNLQLGAVYAQYRHLCVYGMASVRKQQSCQDPNHIFANSHRPQRHAFKSTHTQMQTAQTCMHTNHVIQPARSISQTFNSLTSATLPHAPLVHDSSMNTLQSARSQSQQATGHLHPHLLHRNHISATWGPCLHQACAAWV